MVIDHPCEGCEKCMTTGKTVHILRRAGTAVYWSSAFLISDAVPYSLSLIQSTQYYVLYSHKSAMVDGFEHDIKRSKVKIFGIVR